MRQPQVDASVLAQQQKANQDSIQQDIGNCFRLLDIRLSAGFLNDILNIVESMKSNIKRQGLHLIYSLLKCNLGVMTRVCNASTQAEEAKGV